MLTILFPSSFFNIQKVDDEYKREYDAVKQIPLLDILLFDQDTWFNFHKIKLSKSPQDTIFAIYRGWMMKEKEYEAFYQNLCDQKIQLITTPKMYSLMHLFPNNHDKIKEDTPRILTYPIGMPINIEKVKQKFSRFMTKDYVKSLKDTSFPAFFDSSITQEKFDSYIESFRKCRGDLFTDGICIKEYVELKKYDTKANEYRAFYYYGKLISVYQNSKQEKETPKPPEELVKKYQNLKSNFYTIDYAELQNGSWIILETGDGSVSGLPEKQDPLEFYLSISKSEENTVHKTHNR